MYRVSTLPFTSFPPRCFRSRKVTCMGSKAGEPAQSGPRFVSVDGADRAREAVSERGFIFRLVSYNILAQELDEFDEFYKKSLENCGYLSIYIQRNGRKRDGCGIFYKSSCAELVSSEEINYNDLVELVGSDNTSKENKKDLESEYLISDNPSAEELLAEVNSKEDNRDPNDPHVRLKRDCVGILAAFRLNSPSHHLLIVANTHLYWDPEWADVKLAQAEYLLSRLSHFKRVVENKFGCTSSVIVAGDFNSIPGDMVYQFLVTGTAPCRHLPDTSPLIPLRSLYASAGGQEPPFTNCTPGFTGTLDYIFLSTSGDLTPISLLQIPGPESIEVAGGLPNFYHPSDHLPIGGDFEVMAEI